MPTRFGAGLKFGQHDTGVQCINYGEAWITVDKQKIATMGTLRFDGIWFKTVSRLRQQRECADGQSAFQNDEYHDARPEAQDILNRDGVFAAWDVNKALFAYLNLNIDDALLSNDPIIRAFAMLDKRFGKRRLATFIVQNAHPLVTNLYVFRCRAEGISPLPVGFEGTEPDGLLLQQPSDLSPGK